jgi:hypothetical protein
MSPTKDCQPQISSLSTTIRSTLHYIIFQIVPRNPWKYSLQEARILLWILLIFDNNVCWPDQRSRLTTLCFYFVMLCMYNNYGSVSYKFIQSSQRKWTAYMYRWMVGCTLSYLRSPVIFILWKNSKVWQFQVFGYVHDFIFLAPNSYIMGWLLIEKKKKRTESSSFCNFELTYAFYID